MKLPRILWIMLLTGALGFLAQAASACAEYWTRADLEAQAAAPITSRR